MTELLRPHPDVSTLLRCSRATTYKLIASGEIASITLGARGRIRVPSAALDAFIERNAQNVAADLQGGAAGRSDHAALRGGAGRGLAASSTSTVDEREAT